MNRPSLSLAAPLELLQWQARWRALVVVVAAVAVLGFQAQGWFTGTSRDVMLVLATYLAVVATAAFGGARVSPRMESASVAITILADVAALTAITAVASRPGHHDWVLLVGFFVVHLAEYSFSRLVALLAMVSTALGYLVLFAAREDTSAAEWSEAAYALAIYLAVVGTFMMQYASRRRRLRRIIALFERAEQGDFTEAYDLVADRRPDAVSAVGNAYNRVRTRLEKLVLTDALTGCLNRRGFDQALDRELARTARGRGDVALLALDVDHFKQINDTHGHLAGDDVLRQVGSMLRALVRSGDVVARVGGDEFLVLCPDATREGAAQLAQRLCEKVAAHDFTGQGTRIELSISVGVATSDMVPPTDSAAELQRRADRALYEAKRAGRNRMRCWSHEAGLPAPTSAA